MRVDWEIAKRGWRRYAAYPWATAAGVFTNTIFGFIQAYVLLAVYRHRTTVGGYDAADTVTYVWLAQALIMTVYVFGWQELALRIRDGSIATDLSRPVDPQRYWLAFDLGRAPYHFLCRGVPPFLLGALVFTFHWPTAPHVLLFVVSVVLAIVVSFGFRFLYNSASFWLVDFRGVMTMALVVSLFFSGMIMPLQFFPHWLGTLARALPFSSVMQTPIDVYLGRHSDPTLLALIAEQLGWGLALIGLGRLALRAGTRKLVVQGG